MIGLVVSAPESPAARAELARQIAAVHADAVLLRMKTLPFTPAQRREILRMIQQECREQADR